MKVKTTVEDAVQNLMDRVSALEAQVIELEEIHILILPKLSEYNKFLESQNKVLAIQTNQLKNINSMVSALDSNIAIEEDL